MAVNKVIYAGNTLIDLTQDTVNPAALMVGVAAHNSKGERILGSFNPYTPTLTVITEGGNNITVSNGSKILSESAITAGQTGAYAFDIPSSGTWTATVSNGSASKSESITISSYGQYALDLRLISSLENTSWQAIKSVAQSGTAENYWKIGDTKSFSDGSYTLEAEIADINRNGNNIWFNIKTPKFQRAMWDGQVALANWIGSTYYYTLPQELRAVTSQVQLIEYNDIFGASPFQLFKTLTGRIKGVNWWLGTAYILDPTPERSYYYYCNSSGSSSTANVYTSYYINYKFVIS